MGKVPVPVERKAFAPAKINLSLRVLGRRPDGYHELESLVVFARDVGDDITFLPGTEDSLVLQGPFAPSLATQETQETNLVLQAANTLRHHWPHVPKGTYTLTKNLPVAAGIGGGSADAAAVLRLLSEEIGQDHGEESDVLFPLAQSLGADVPVCLLSRACLMAGVGEKLTPLQRFPEVYAVLVNPGVSLSTAKIFSTLAAPPYASDTNNDKKSPQTPQTSMGFLSVSELQSYLNNFGNDLEAVAKSYAPEIGTVLSALQARDGCWLARMSGSGATCFGLFSSFEAANQAETSLRLAYPKWWVQKSRLG